MVNYLLKKSYRLKDLREVDFEDLWGDHGVFTTMWIFDNPSKILFFKEHINNLIKSEDPIDHPDFFNSCFLNNNPEFINAPQWNFKIPTNSFSVDKGYLSNIIVDIDGNTRFNGNDLGCYEAY